MSTRNKARQIEIAQVWATGITLQAAGEKLGITRERVRQVIQNPSLKEYHARRRAVNLELAEKYSSIPVCQRCREPFKPKQSAKRPGAAEKLCSGCSNRLRIVRLAQSHLRGLSYVYRRYGKWDTPQSLNQAVYLIRKHNLKPEDFR